MIIKKMTATFGKLDGAVLELKEGLNILQAPNEGGKSTWCAFLRAMFYGIPTRERDTKTTLAEKNRYAPWSGAPMAGEVLLTWRGREILLRRFAKGAAPFGGFEAVDAATGETIPGLTGTNCGEVLLGVGREVWQRSAFVGQSGIGVDANPELERRIAALVSSGEEDVSFSETEKTLRAWLNRRKHNKTGLIPRLEEELSALEEAQSTALQNQRRLREAQVQSQALERRRGSWRPSRRPSGPGGTGRCWSSTPPLSRSSGRPRQSWMPWPERIFPPVRSCGRPREISPITIPWPPAARKPEASVRVSRRGWRRRRPPPWTPSSPN